jgi:hypothetical protein
LSAEVEVFSDYDPVFSTPDRILDSSVVPLLRKPATWIRVIAAITVSFKSRMCDFVRWYKVLFPYGFRIIVKVPSLS